MKITKRQLRKIIREEKSRLLKEQFGVNYNPTPIDKDAVAASKSIAYSLFETLEELGADAQTAREIHHLLKTTAWLDSALDKTLNDYLKKLKMMGGTPKPRNI